MVLKQAMASIVASVLAKSYYLTQLARLVVQIYDNDQNANMYKNGEVRLVKHVLRNRPRNAVFVDVGANKGDWSEALVRCGIAGRLILVDPLRRNLEEASRRLRALGYKGFEVCECALSNEQTTTAFFVSRDPRHSGTDSLYDMRTIGYTEAVDTVEVRCITLDALADQLGIAEIEFLKVDVEGHELFVLRGASELLRQGRVRFIQMEFGHAARAAGVYLHDIVRFVGQYQYKIFVIKPSGLLPLDFSPFTENRYSYINFLIASTSALSELQGQILRK